jgi:hypothetical protein
MTTSTLSRIILSGEEYLYAPVNSDYSVIVSRDTNGFTTGVVGAFILGVCSNDLLRGSTWDDLLYFGHGPTGAEDSVETEEAFNNYDFASLFSDNLPGIARQVYGKIRAELEAAKKPIPMFEDFYADFFKKYN